jgi:hypothetical protein
LLSDCDCFSFRSLIYMFMKWICFIKFSTYSSYILRLGLRPKPEAVMFYLVVMPSTLEYDCTFGGDWRVFEIDWFVHISNGNRNL